MAEQTKKRPELTYGRVIRHVAMCTPAVRMVALRGWIDEDGTFGSWAYPVLALKTTVRDKYVKRGAYVHFPGGTHKTLEDHGWEFCEQDEELTAILVDDSCLLAYDDSCFADYLYKQLVVCTWPEDQDAEKFAPLLKEMHAKMLPAFEREQQEHREREAKTADKVN